MLHDVQKVECHIIVLLISLVLLFTLEGSLKNFDRKSVWLRLLRRLLSKEYPMWTVNDVTEKTTGNHPISCSCRKPHPFSRLLFSGKPPQSHGIGMASWGLPLWHNWWSTLYIIGVYGKNHIFAKCFFVFYLPGTESTLPSTLLANMAGFANEKLPSIFSFAKTTQSRLLETIRLNS